MDRPVTCDQLLSINGMGSTLEVRHCATSFSQDDHPSRHVPRVECHFPKSIEPAGCDIAEIQGCCSGSAQSLYLQRKSYEVVQIIIRGLANVVRKSGHEERTIEMVRCGHGNGNSIEVSPMTDLCGEEFV